MHQMQLALCTRALAYPVPSASSTKFGLLVLITNVAQFFEAEDNARNIRK